MLMMKLMLLMLLCLWLLINDAIDPELSVCYQWGSHLVPPGAALIHDYCLTDQFDGETQCHSIYLSSCCSESWTQMDYLSLSDNDLSPSQVQSDYPGQTD